MKLRLRDGISFCWIERRAVFLDLDADRYFCLPADANSAFEALVMQEGVDDASLQALVPLIARGALIAADVSCPPIRPTWVPSATTSLLDNDSARARPLGIAQAVAARLFTTAQLSGRPLASIIATIRRAKHGLSPDATGAFRLTQCRVAHDFDAANRVSSANGRCLVNAIAAMRTLVAHGSPADMIFGVRLNPFMAHCWVQGPYGLVTDRLDQTSGFTPILAI